jgi:hypothetical protein
VDGTVNASAAEQRPVGREGVKRELTAYQE